MFGWAVAGPLQSEELINGGRPTLWHKGGGAQGIIECWVRSSESHLTWGGGLRETGSVSYAASVFAC